MLIHLLPRVGRSVLAVGVLTVLVACASAPVQQMSDARQAIRAAQDAGATVKAPQPLSEAQAALSRAESLLKKRMFSAARRSADEARTKATIALRQAREEPTTKN